MKNCHFKNSHSVFKRLSWYFNNLEFTVMFELYTNLIRCAMVDIKGCCAMVDIKGCKGVVIYVGPDKHKGGGCTRSFTLSRPLAYKNLT